MMSLLTSLAWLFINPIDLPSGTRFWMMLPLVACVATVYRATRVRRAEDMPRSTFMTFLNIVVGMTLIAAAFYAVHMIVQRWGT